MKKLTTMALLAVPLLAAVPFNAHAQGAVPRHRTAAGIAQSAPSATDLLHKMRGAVQRSGSFHFSGSFTIAIPQVSRTVVQLEGDESTQHNAAHVFVTTQAGGAAASGTGSTRMEIVVAGQKYAQRSGQQPWQCQGAASLRPLLRAVAGAGKIANARNLGATTVDGVLAWRVRARSAITFRGIHLAGPVNYYISQRDFTLVKNTARATLRSGLASLHERQVIHYSRYGVPVQVQLPAVCANRST
ncbi:MAG: hypothetical protein PVSMB7_22520 [Chloroflexota bacterium]